VPARNVRRSITRSARSEPVAVGYTGRGAIGSGSWMSPPSRLGGSLAERGSAS
jgi:hypothetical protein